MGIGSFLTGFGSAATKNTFEEMYKVNTLEKDKIHKENRDTIAMLHSISQMPANERPTAIKLIPNKDVQRIAEIDNINFQAAIVAESERLGMPPSDFMKNLTPDKLALVYQKKDEVKIETDNRQKAQGIANTVIGEMQKKIKNLSNMATMDGVIGGGVNELGGATGTTRPLTEIEKLESSNEIILETISKLGSGENYKLYIETLGKYIDNNNKRIEELEKVKEPKEYAPQMVEYYNPETKHIADIDENIPKQIADIRKLGYVKKEQEKKIDPYRKDRVRNDIVSKFNANPNVRKTDQMDNFADLIIDVANSDNPIGHASLETLMARASGEVGNLSEADKRPFGGSRALTAKTQQYFSELYSGKKTPENLKFISQLANTFKEVGRKKKKEYARTWNKQYSKANKDMFEQDEIYHMLAPDLDEQTDLSEISTDDLKRMLNE